MKNLSPEQRKELASTAARKRWSQERVATAALQKEDVPAAIAWGTLSMGDSQLPCYVLNNGDRVFSLKGVVVGLIETDGGQLAEYIKVSHFVRFFQTISSLQNMTLSQH